MTQARALAIALASTVLLIAGGSPARAADAPRGYTLDAAGRVESITTELGTTSYRYFETGSIRDMVDFEGRRYLFAEGAAAATLAAPSPNFLPFVAATVLNPLDHSANRFGFTGFLYERELGVYFTPSARMYDPAVGRFIQADSHSGALEDPPSLHRYLYGHANPLRFVDPTGHSDVDANRLAAAMHGQTGFLASDHRPAEQRGWWYNALSEVYADLPPRLIPMRQFEGLARQDGAEFALGTGESFLAALAGELVKGGMGALVERFPKLGASVTEMASEGLARLKGPAPAAPPPPATGPALTRTTTVSQAARTDGAFIATEEGRLAPAVPRVAGGSQGAELLSPPTKTLWAEGPTTRGVLAEKRLAATDYKDWYHVGAEDSGRFPLVDFQKDTSLVSLKTVDTAGKSWAREMRSHIRDLSSRGAIVDGQPATMILDLRVPPGGADAAKALVPYGERFGVTVVIKEIK